MDAGQPHSRSTHSASSSSSSAVDITGAGARLAVPHSPTSNTGHARRRASWGNEGVAPSLRPLHLNLPVPPTGLSSLGRSTAPQMPIMGLEDPFYTATEQAYNTREHSLDSLPSISDSEGDDGREEAKLTTKPMLSASIHGASTSTEWLAGDNADAEHTGGTTPRTRRRAIARASGTPSPLKRTATAIRNALHRTSRRVASVRAHDLSVRLPDDDDDDNDVDKATLDLDVSEGPNSGDDEANGHTHQSVPRQSQGTTPLRGNTLGCLGPTNPLRLRLYYILSHQYSEPIILVLILATAVVLVIQASRSNVLPPNQTIPSSQTGYFHTWEDYALFVFYVLFTIESFARACVSGFLLDPEVPTSLLLSALSFSSFRSTATPTASVSAINTPPISRSGSLFRGILFRRFFNTLARPFTLPLNPLSGSLMYAPTESSSSQVDQNSTSATKPPLKQAQSRLPRLHIRDPSQPTFFSRVLRSDVPRTENESLGLPFRLDVHVARQKLARNLPYLRQSWGRTDFIAVIAFWGSFGLATAGVERGSYHVGVLRALSVLRVARLLAITSGTTTIMHSLKVARPLLASVAYFVVFAILFFSIIGVQSFKGSLRRNCYLLPTLGEGPTQLMNAFCGGYVNATTLQPSPYLYLDGLPADMVKGYICPAGQICQEGQNPNDGVESFDTVWYSTLQVIVLASANTWSQVMYQVMAAEYFVSCFFFVAGILVLNFWLINLFVAVITNTFSAIRAETRKSAFGAAPLGSLVEEQEEGWAVLAGRHVTQNKVKVFYSYTRWGWIFLALASLVVQATTTANMSQRHQQLLYNIELFLTVAFDVEILIRIVAELPAWRVFFNHGNNWFDLILALGSTVVQIPAIHQSNVYPWLTIFQIARFYRVILEFPRMRPLMLTVFGNLYGLANMTLFLILVNLLAALVAIQLIQGDMNSSATMNFAQLWNSFLAVYQVFSSENWTTVLYNATSAELPLGQAFIVATFISCWFLFANFIVLQMFIAVINENFSVAEEAKKDKQASDYWARYSQERSKRTRWLSRLNPYRWFKADPVTLKVGSLPWNLVLPMRESLVQDYSPPEPEQKSTLRRTSSKGIRHAPSRSMDLLQKLFSGNTRTNDIPLIELRQSKSKSASESESVEDEIGQNLEMLAWINHDGISAEALNDELQERRARKADFIRNHPTYDKTFWIFTQQNSFRRLCQKIVKPAGDDRIFGTPPNMVAHTIFQLLIFLTIVGGIATEIAASSLYRHNYYVQHGLHRWAWFNIAETVFGLALLGEFLIKIVADGLLFTPNAHIRSIWNVIDGIILIGILTNVALSLIFIGSLNRFVHALKALRALRFITLIEQMRNTFEHLIISGVVRILDAALLAILYLIPFSVWGTTIFAGLMGGCNDNDPSVHGIGDCTGEYVNTIYGSSFGFPVPRAWDYPSPSTTFSFDNFRSSMLILFEIVSLEGWIDVMSVAMSITGVGQQPQTNVSEANAIFFVIYNLLGGVVILTIFVSIIIGHFSSQTGSAFLTQPQREWIDLQKLIKRQKPSKRPVTRPRSAFRAWCYDRAIYKHGWWSRTMTFLFVLQIIVLMTDSYGTHPILEGFRVVFALFLTSIYVLDTTIRFYGLGWESFCDNGWNIFDVIVAFGSFATTMIVQSGSTNSTIQQLQKLFLVCIVFKLVQRTDSLNQLFKTGTASLPVILSLLGLWFIFFLFFAIMYMEVFGMTRWYSAETSTQNYQTMGSALLMLAFMSTGEGWNQYMHDYATVYPRCTYIGGELEQTDCGSVVWALSLFIAWNLLSMYIILNMFTGVVVENFSYVFQSTGGAKVITRQEMRSCKEVWAEFANPTTGLLERPNFGRFLAKLNGVFEARIYPEKWSVKAILDACRDDSRRATKTEGVNLRKLNQILSNIDHTSIRKRRHTYSRIYHEAIIASHPSGTLSFTDMLMLLAHHKLIDDREALVLKDLVARQVTNKLITDLVNLDRVRSLLKMLSRRRRYLAGDGDLNQSRDIPTIFVNSSPPTKQLPMSTRDITSPHSDNEAGQSDYDASTPSPSPRILMPSPELSVMEQHFRTSLQRARRVSDVSMLSADMSQRYWEPESATDIIASIEQSMWGEMMSKAVQESND